VNQKTKDMTWEEWLASRSPRRILIEELTEKFYDARRELWQLCPCPECRLRHGSFRPDIRVPMLPGQAVEDGNVVPCKKCEGKGFLVDWENEL
jgi:hypothetical protein